MKLKHIIAAELLALMTSCAQNPLFLNYKGKYGTYSVTPNEIIIVPHYSAK